MRPKVREKSSSQDIEGSLEASRRAAFSREAAELGRLVEGMDARARAARAGLLPCEQGRESDQGHDPSVVVVPFSGCPTVSELGMQSRHGRWTPDAAERILRAVRPIDARLSPRVHPALWWIALAAVVTIVVVGIGLTYSGKF